MKYGIASSEAAEPRSGTWRASNSSWADGDRSDFFFAFGGRRAESNANVGNMDTLQVELPVDLVRVANLDTEHLSADTARVVALLLFREDRISLGRAAELCGTPVEAFIQFAGRHGVPLHYGVEELEQDRRNMTRIGL